MNNSKLHEFGVGYGSHKLEMEKVGSLEDAASASKPRFIYHLRNMIHRVTLFGAWGVLRMPSRYHGITELCLFFLATMKTMMKEMTFIERIVCMKINL